MVFLNRFQKKSYLTDCKGNLSSHTTNVLCVNVLHKWRYLKFKVDSERQVFEKLFIAIFIYSQSFCKKSAEIKSMEKYFFMLTTTILIPLPLISLDRWSQWIVYKVILFYLLYVIVFQIELNSALLYVGPTNTYFDIIAVHTITCLSFSLL